MRTLALIALVACATPASADPRITIEKATMPWSELERLLRNEGAAPPRVAPHAYAIPNLVVSGEIDEGRATLTLTFDVQVLGERWTVAPLLPAALAVSSATVTTPDGKRGLLVRDRGGVAFAGEGAGRYQISLEAEGALERLPSGARLALLPPGLAGGRARLVVHGVDRVEGRTAWHATAAGGSLTVEAALGAAGVELIVPAASAALEAGAALDELEAITVLSLGGSGVTRLIVNASADASGELVLALPPGARLWKAYVGAVALPAAALGRRETIRLPLRHAARVEVAYTFDLPPLGIRGRYHVELPRLPVPVRAARWELWLPDGLSYGAPQAALAPSSCGEHGRARTPILPQGKCLGFARPVLEPGRVYIEGTYDQPL